MAALALPFIAVEGAVIASEASVPIISGLGAFVNSVLAFTGAGALLNDAIKIFSPEKAPNPQVLTERISQPQITKLEQLNSDPLQIGQKQNQHDIFNKSPLNRH